MRAQRLASLPLANPILNQGSLQVLSRAGRHISPAARELLDHIVRGIGTPSAPPSDTVE
ncbi:hypothetical protein D9M69_681840 [compost metagenome]